MAETLISEAIRPVPGTFDVSGMARGEPGLPARFVWRDTEHEVADVLERWKTSVATEGERYLRRHWFKITTRDGTVMTLYCERQPKSPGQARRRWRLYTVTSE